MRAVYSSWDTMSEIHQPFATQHVAAVKQLETLPPGSHNNIVICFSVDF